MKRSLSLILSICLVLTLFAGIVPAAGAVTYSDVKKSDWSYNAIYYLTDKNVLAGDGTGRFRPTNKVTHIEFIKMMVAAFNLKASTRVNYTDVPTWAQEGLYLEKAAAQGFLLDYAKDFDFESKLTREEAVALLMRYLDLDTETYMASTSRVPDYTEISSKYRTYALTAVGAGVIKGDEKGNFNPQDVLTREQALQILYNAAGAIYTKSAVSADANAPKTNATINGAANLSGINFLGNVYITEDVSAVYLKNCVISGELYVRGDTEVIIENSIVNTLTVKGAGAEIELDGTTEAATVNVNATAEIELDKEALVKKMLLNTGSRNSTITGEGEIVNIAVRDHGISTSGVVISDEYYIYPGYTATFDGILYQAGTGKHLSSSIISATVSGIASAAYGSKSNITFNVKTNATGTLYAVAWKKTEDTLDANAIANVIGSASATTARASQSVTAGIAVTFAIPVDGSYADYNVGLIFVPYGGTVSASKLTPYYNKGEITAIATAMTTDAPTKAKSTAPTWTLSSSSTATQNVLTITFNQTMYYKASATAAPQALSTLTSTALASLVSVDKGNARLYNFTVVSEPTSTTLNLYFTKGDLQIGVNYTVAISGSIVNGTGSAPEIKVATVAFGSSAAAGLDAPTLTSTSGTSSVSSTDSVIIGFPAGATKVLYQITVDGIDRPAQTITTTTRIPFSTFLNAKVIEITAYAVDNYGNALGATATGTYYMGSLPLIYVDGVAYAGTGNIVKVSGSYNISAGTVGSTTDISIERYVDGAYVQSYNFSGSYAAPTTTSKTFTIKLVNVHSYAVIAETSVTVVYEAASSGTVTAAPAPTVSSNNSTLFAGQSNNISNAFVTVNVPSAVGYTYTYAIDGVTVGTLTNGSAEQMIKMFDQSLMELGVSKTLTITASTATGVPSGVWSWIIKLGR